MIKPLSNSDRSVEIAAWMRRHYARWRSHSAAHILSWIRWHAANNMLLVIRWQGKIIGVAGLRRLAHKAEDRNPFAHVPNGPLMWISFTVTTHPRALAALWILMLQRCSGSAWLGYARSKVGGRVRWMPIARMTRLVLGMTNGGVTGGLCG